MTGLNIPFCDGDDIVEEADEYGFTTTVNFHFSPVNNIPMNTRHDSQSSAFLITGRVIYHHATKSGIPADSLAHGYRRILGILRNWTHTVTKGRVDPRPIAVVHDFGLAEAWVGVKIIASLMLILKYSFVWLDIYCCFIGCFLSYPLCYVS